MPSFQQLNDYGNFIFFLIDVFLASMNGLQIGLYPTPLGHTSLRLDI